LFSSLLFSSLLFSSLLSLFTRALDRALMNLTSSPSLSLSPTFRWSAVSRTERYRNRLQEAGDDEAAAKVDSENPIPDFMDPITLEPVIAPAISPYGHVMGSATWRAVLGAQGVCPFTKKPLRWEQCKVLTKNNYDAYKDSIIQ